MDEKKMPAVQGLDGVVAALCRYLLEKGNWFDHGPDYEGDGKVLASVGQTVQLYQDLGYSKVFEMGQPPSYALLRRGHRELHVFQPKDPQVRRWLADEQANPNDSTMRATLLNRSGVSEESISVATKPRHYHINEVDEVFIVATDEA
ncbi:MAG: hypothetical protein WAT67_06265 [Candidatus Contendobacter sp.]